jgi:hypothetical protein
MSLAPLHVRRASAVFTILHRLLRLASCIRVPRKATVRMATLVAAGYSKALPRPKRRSVVPMVQCRGR